MHHVNCEMEKKHVKTKCGLFTAVLSELYVKLLKEKSVPALTCILETREKTLV